MLKIGLLSQNDFESLESYLLQTEHQVFLFSDFSEFQIRLSRDAHLDILFISESFLSNTSIQESLNVFLQRSSHLKNIKVYILSQNLSPLKVEHEGVLSPFDYKAISRLIKKSEEFREDDVLSFEEDVEVELLEMEESLEDEAVSSLLKASLNLNKADSLDQLFVFLCGALQEVLPKGQKGVLFKYLPTYSSLIAVNGFNISKLKLRGLGLNFSAHPKFNADLHLNRLLEMESFKELSEKIIGHSNLELRTLSDFEGVKAILVYEKNDKPQAELHMLCDYASTSMEKICYKKLYYKNRTRDPLTSCYLREHFFEMVQNEILRAKRLHLPLSVFMLEIDHFEILEKSFNKERIHTLYKSIASLLSGHTRHNDAVAKMQGPYFLVLFPHMNIENALKKAKRLRSILNETEFFTDMKKSLKCDFSISYAVYPNQFCSVDEMFLLLKKTLKGKEKANTVLSIKSSPGFVKDFEEQELPTF